MESGPLSLDPRVGVDLSSWRVHQAVYNALVKNGPGGEFRPDLAESWSTEEARVWRFRLRPGVRFHDGRALTSADVAFTYRSLLDPAFESGKKKGLEDLESIETPGPLEIVFRLKAPNASFPLQLLFGILPDGTTREAAATAPIGTGPWRLTAFRPDDRVDFARFDGYFDGPALLPRLVYRVVPDATTRALELIRGSVHLTINSLPPDLLPRFRATPGLAVTILPGATYGYVAFNLRDPALAKREVRQALDLALDRDALVHGLWRDTVEATASLLPKGHWARDDELRPAPRDVDAAKRLLDAAGFPDPGGGRPRLTLTWKTSTDEMSLLQATAVASQWREAGVDVRIRSNDFAVFFQDVVKGSFQLFSLRWTGIVDPDHFREVFHSTGVPPRGWNRGFYADPDVDRWVSEARVRPLRSLRRPLYLAVQRRVAEDLPYLSLYTARTVAVHAANLTGIGGIPENGDFTFLSRVGRR